MTTPFIDLKTQYIENKSSIDAAIQKVLTHGQYIMGPEIEELEAKLAAYVGVSHALTCSSGTDALVLPMMTKGLTRSDAIFTTPFTFFASAEAITLAGGTPVFVDIDPDTYNIDPKSLAEKIEKISNEGILTPRGILAVDLFGITANYDEIQKIANTYNLFVIEDSAQSFGANYRGKKACSFGDVGTTSFYPAKPLGCYGDGGAIFTNDSSMHQEMISLRVHGQAHSGNKYDNTRVGLNARMDTIQAAVLLEKIKFYESELQARNAIADLYSARLQEYVKTPIVPNEQTSVWAQYSIQVPDRKKVCNTLQENNIPFAIFYPTPIHLSTAYAELKYKPNDFPVSESVAGKILSLPMHPYLKEEQIETVCDTIINCLAN